MFGSGHVRQWWKGIFPSNASRWCYRAAARSAPIRPESTKRWLRLAFIPIGLLASRSVPSTARSLPEIHRKRDRKIARVLGVHHHQSVAQLFRMDERADG